MKAQQKDESGSPVNADGSCPLLFAKQDIKFCRSILIGDKSPLYVIDSFWFEPHG